MTDFPFIQEKLKMLIISHKIVCDLTSADFSNCP